MVVIEWGHRKGVVEFCGAPWKGFQTRSLSLNDKTSTCPLFKSEWRLKVGLNLPQAQMGVISHI